MPDELGAPLEGLDPSHDRATVVNETDLPDDVVIEAVEDYFVENASLAWGRPSTFQNYVGNGSLLTRTEFRAPTNILDEIRLARELAERDDDIGGAMGSMIATAFSDGMENFHEDEKTLGLFNGCAKDMNLDGVLKDFYREYLISSSLTTVSLFTRTKLAWRPSGSEVEQEESVACPMSGILPAENIRVLGDDTFGTATLAYDPDDENLRKWLIEFFSETTSPARKAQMGRENRVAANMFTGIFQPNVMGYEELAPYNGDHLFLLNPKVVHRTTMPKGSWNYPRPLITRNFPLLEAKRLLNIMDFALLQGGSNFIVVVKKGSDQRPARPEEIANLQQVVRTASRTGVIVGDHRLDIEVITPDLKELLNPAKRRLIGRKLAMSLLRVPEAGVEDPGVEGMRSEIELVARTITSDRHDIKRHVERHIYAETLNRNKRLFDKGAPKLWFPKIVLQGSNYFTDFVLKLRDRGDIPRKWAVEAGGFDYDAAVHQRQRELDAGDDEVLLPAAVPHSSPEMGPQDNNEGRPRNGADDRTRQRIGQNSGETIKAIFDEELAKVIRIGEVTHAILEEYADYTVGRITSFEREALDSEETVRRGPNVAVAVNRGVEVDEEKAVRLAPGLSLITGQRKVDRGLIAKVLVFREPEYSPEDAETAVARWGFPVVDLASLNLPSPHEGNGNGGDEGRSIEEIAQAIASAQSQAPNIHVEVQSGRVKRVVQRDPETGQIVGSEEVPVEDGEE